MVRATGLVAAVAAACVAGVQGTVELDPASFKEAVESSGKNVFVKFFAPWCGHCKRLKPDWDKLAEEYDGSSSVLIADVDCTKHQALCSEYGVSGYPTLKYFKDGDATAKDYQNGRSLDKLQSFVSEELEIACQINDAASSCTEKEQGYHTKWAAKTAEEQATELERLKKMTAGSMKAELKQWLVSRINILSQLTAA